MRPLIKYLAPVFPQAEEHPVFFLDRDDTLIPDHAYLSDPDGVELLPNAAEGLKLLREKGYRLVLVSNQSGVGRGLITMEQLAAVHARLVQILAENGVALDAAYLCPHAPSEECACRKPLTGLIDAARKDFAIPQGSVMAGDKAADIQLARNAGLVAIQIRCPKRPGDLQADYAADDLLDAAKWLAN
ncbi:MAG: HAD family hydrolase [Lentisphaeria bacterium]|nr:HAD family hydrolase [Lentisphaeria bacterium]